MFFSSLVSSVFLKVSACPTPPSSAAPGSSPTSLVQPLRSSCGKTPTWCAWQESHPLLSPPPLLAATVSARLPIVLSVRAPFCDVRLRKLFGLVGSHCGLLRYHSKTRSQK